MKLSLCLAALLLAMAAPLRAASPGVVNVTGVATNHSSVKVFFEPFPGAKDYRVYDVSNPNDVKYAGLIHLTASAGCTGNAPYDQRGPDANGNPQTSCYQHLAVNADGSLAFPYRAAEFSYPNGSHGGPTGYDGPAYFIDYNGVGDGQQHVLVVEAVDALGPVPKMSLYREVDIKAFAPMFSMAGMTPMLGSNKGMTDDGKISTNGQGPYTSNPQVLGVSRPFVVQVDRNYTPLIPGASQTFLDTFENGEPFVEQAGDCPHYVNDRGDVGGKEWTLNAGTPKAWRIIGREINCEVTMPFITSNHFMDMLGDGSNTIYSSLAMTPDKTFQLNGGILHLTQEVDDVMFGDRWMDFNVAPASDPLVHWNNGDKAANSSNQWLFMQNFGTFSQFNAQLTISNGPGGDVNAPGAGVNAFINGAGGVGDQFDARTLTPNGLGFDARRRWDLFVSQTHGALFIDGRLVAQGDLPADKAAWLSGPLKVYFTHYMYHSEAGWKSMLTNPQGYPPGFCNLSMFAYWFNDPENGILPGAQVTTIFNGQRVPANGYGLNNCAHAFAPGYGFRDTDERHWDNMGAEVLPASFAPKGDFSALGVFVQPPNALPAVFSGTISPPLPVNCAVSDWGPWLPGQAGFETRTRTITIQPANGGAACPALSESRPVVTPPSSNSTCFPEVQLPALGVKYSACIVTTPL